MVDYDLVKEKMKGFLVNRVEVIFAVPEVIFFKKLARQKGHDADSAFFDLLYQTRPEVWPVYMEQRTDFSGCTKHGSGLLVDLHGKWQSFKRSYPTAYTPFARKVVSDFEKRLTYEKFPCGSDAVVIDEMELFIKAYPDSDLSKKLRRSIEEMRREK